jgi:4a-hydroxytetrahydrobiopterin dehydratase
MVEAITPREFHEAVGVDDWRVLGNGASAYIGTGSFDKGVAFVNEIAELADAANHHPDVELRYSSVRVRLSTHEVNALTERDVMLARQISHAARTLALASDHSKVQEVQIAIDAIDIPVVRRFWQAVLDYQDEGDEDLIDPSGHGPSLWFQQMDSPRVERNRIHLDVIVPHDLAEARVASVLAAGGRLVTDKYAPSWWVLADPEGNEACVATWMDRE